MDVEKELAAVDRKIKRQIDQRFDEAMARNLGISLETYKLQKAALQLQSYVSPMQALGIAYRNIHDSFVAMAEQFAKGWQQAAKK